MLEITNGYELFIRGYVGHTLTIAVQSVPSASIGIVDNDVKISLAEPRHSLVDAEIEVPGFIRALLQDREQETGPPAFIFRQELSSSLDPVEESIREALIQYIPDLHGGDEEDKSSKQRAIDHTVKGLMTDIRAKEAYWEVQEREGATSASMN
ncbi:MAG TPA: hypothetical protein VMR75_02225 [Candidatus Saccharimonadales bacterium]|nr:hypothetical protein [Candidatus Saccharimonadales bacterium]